MVSRIKVSICCSEQVRIVYTSGNNKLVSLILLVVITKYKADFFVVIFITAEKDANIKAIRNSDFVIQLLNSIEQ